MLLTALILVPPLLGAGLKGSAEMKTLLGWENAVLRFGRPKLGCPDPGAFSGSWHAVQRRGERIRGPQTHDVAIGGLWEGEENGGTLT